MATTLVKPKTRPKRRRKRPAAHRPAPRIARARWCDSLAKRIADVVLALPLLLAALPLLLACGAWIRWASTGPAIYRQTRAGRNGVPFTLLKLRTMHLGSETESGPRWASDRDPRVIPGGRFLRSYHLDELPQLWNVLRGEMSLVGPRPERPEILRTLRSEIPDIDERVSARPGITGLAQVTLPPDGSVESVGRKLRVDCDYLRKSSFRLDCRILVWTVLKLLGQRRGWIYAYPTADVLSMATRLDLGATQPVLRRAA